MLELMVSFSVTIAVFVVFLQLGINVFYQEQAIASDYQAQIELEMVEKAIDRLFTWVNEEGNKVYFEESEEALSIFHNHQLVFFFGEGKMVVIIGQPENESTKFTYQISHIEFIEAERVNSHLIIFSFKELIIRSKGRLFMWLGAFYEAIGALDNRKPTPRK